MNTVSVYGLLIVVAWCSFPSPAEAQCTGESQNCTYGSDTCCNGTFCLPPDISDYEYYEEQGESLTCEPCRQEGDLCLLRGGPHSCCSDPNPNVEIKCQLDKKNVRRHNPYSCQAVCKGVGEECREGRDADCCRGYENHNRNDIISCLKSNSSGRFECTKTLGIYKRCGRDAQSTQITRCKSGLSCVERNALVTPQEFAQQVYNTSDLGVLGGVVSDLQLKKYVCDPIRPPSCIEQEGPCTANYRGKGNCCSPKIFEGDKIAYCRNDTAVSAGSPVYNGVCAKCVRTVPLSGDCTSDEQCCPIAGGYCRGMKFGPLELHKKCRQCSSTGGFCDDVIKCCSPNHTCVSETIGDSVHPRCQLKSQ